MNPDLKKKWIEALRSGKYKQGQSRLRSQNEEFCCLGVLCDMINPSKWQEFNNCPYKWMGWNGGLPTYFMEVNLQHEFIRMNDKEGKSFFEIADWIEKNL